MIYSASIKARSHFELFSAASAVLTLYFSFLQSRLTFVKGNPSLQAFSEQHRYTLLHLQGYLLCSLCENRHHAYAVDSAE